MKELLLHVGHSKTGSTWLQAILSQNRDVLRSSGILYPERGTLRRADSTDIVLGNAANLLADIGVFRSFLRTLPLDEPQTRVLYSSEELFPQLLRLGDSVLLTDAANQFGFGSVRILLYIRNPVDHALSLWQQYLKRGGGTVDVDKFVDKYAVPFRVADFLSIYGDHPNLDVTVLNYSHHQDSLIESFSDWLNVDSGEFRIPKAKRLNRSLTSAELVLQRALNQELGRSGCLLSDALCQEIPNLPHDDPDLPLHRQQAMCDRLARAAKEVNARIPPREWYQNDIREMVERPSAMMLTEQQLEIVASTLGAEIRRLRLKLANRPGSSNVISNKEKNGLS